MTTWTFRGLVAALGLTTLTACEAGQGLNLGPGLNQQAGRKATLPLSRANMTAGVILVAPNGFCIDRASLEPRFAVMARCDTLGVKGVSGSAPRGLVTVSLTPAKPGPLPTAQQMAAASALENVDDVETSVGLVTFRAQGRLPVGGYAPTQWRGAARIGGQIAGIAVYGPENGEIISSTGRGILRQMVNLSVEATPKPIKRAAVPN